LEYWLDSKFTAHRSECAYKIFCVGQNKTGTTSIGATLKELGYKLGNQRVSQLLLPHYLKQDYSPIFKFCSSADAFQDIPFSLPNFYKALDKEFPNSKFILTERNNAEEWYHSMINWEIKRFSKDGLGTPTLEQLRNANHCYQGFCYDVKTILYPNNLYKLYDKEVCIRKYKQHNQDVKDYFKNRPSQLLVINLSNATHIHHLCSFLKVESTLDAFLHLNRNI